LTPAALTWTRLKAMYQKEEETLKSKLLSGALWHEVQKHHKKVTELSIALHKKYQSLGGLNPAEHSSVDMENR
jgi:hypothetical protein